MIVCLVKVLISGIKKFFPANNFSSTIENKVEITSASRLMNLSSASHAHCLAWSSAFGYILILQYTAARAPTRVPSVRAEINDQVFSARTFAEALMQLFSVCKWPSKNIVQRLQKGFLATC